MSVRVFVTRELYPFTAGGIGRVVANMLVAMGNEERKRTVVVYVGSELGEERFKTIYPDVGFKEASYKTFRAIDEAGRHYPPMGSYSNSVLNWESVVAMQALRELEADCGTLEYVEFPDWGGLAFATTQEKMLGRAFGSATLAIRLHTTDSVLADRESRFIDVHALAVYDMERKALADCDVIVAQLTPVSDEMRNFYGFDGDEWNLRVRVHAPPVYLDTREPVAESIVFDEHAPIVFSSKIQSIKRPEVFLEGAIEFMRRMPAYRGSVVFLAHAFDASYLERIKDLIPEQFRGRVVFSGGLQGKAREDVIARSICVFPSPWESFCLATYEASMSGAICVINERNPAFGIATPWFDGENCYKFDGSADSLADALALVFEAKASVSVVKHPGEPWPWEKQEAVATVGVSSTLPHATVIIVGSDDGADMIRCLDTVVSVEWPSLSVCVLPPRKPDALARKWLESVEEGAYSEVNLENTRQEGTVSQMLGEACSDALVVVVDAAARIESGFVRDALATLARNHSVSVVVGQGAFDSSTARDLRSGQHYEGYEIVHGEARAAGLYENRVVAGVYAARSKCIGDTVLADLYDYFGNWRVLHHAACANRRFAVASEVVAVRPWRRGPNRDDRPPMLGYHDMVTKRSLCLGSARLPAYCLSVAPFGTGGILGRAAYADESQELRRAHQELALLRSSGSVRLALGLSRRLNAVAPWVMRLAARALRKPATVGTP